ncbi:hypothetical protein GQ600_25627 [Phytophthora cactorum]|nr:hypothetical protein GQ600_25627 [Phytophthora cactorum]
MRFRVANETHHDLASKGDIIDVGFKLILMRIEVRSYCVLELPLNYLLMLMLYIEDWKTW